MLRSSENSSALKIRTQREIASANAAGSDKIALLSIPRISRCWTILTGGNSRHKCQRLSQSDEASDSCYRLGLTDNSLCRTQISKRNCAQSTVERWEIAETPFICHFDQRRFEIASDDERNGRFESERQVAVTAITCCYPIRGIERTSSSRVSSLCSARSSAILSCCLWKTRKVKKSMKTFFGELENDNIFPFSLGKMIEGEYYSGRIIKRRRMGSRARDKAEKAVVEGKVDVVWWCGKFLVIYEDYSVYFR